MAGSSWRGDPAATRRGAFDRLQEACANEESARARQAEAQKAVREAERALARATSETAAAVAATATALEQLIRAVPGTNPVDYLPEDESVLPEDEPAPSAGER